MTDQGKSMAKAMKLKEMYMAEEMSDQSVRSLFSMAKGEYQALLRKTAFIAYIKDEELEPRESALIFHIKDASLPYVKAVWWFLSRIPLERVASELGSFECLRPNDLPAPALLPLLPLEAAKFKFIDWVNEHQLDVEKAQIFAILDIVRASYQIGKIVCSAEDFEIPDASANAIPFIDGYLAGFPAGQLAELHLGREEINHAEYYGVVRDSGHAEQLRAERLAANNRELAEPAPDIPRTEADLKSYHRELYLAIVDCSQAVEQDGSTARKNLATMRNIDVEILAWGVLIATINAQQGKINLESVSKNHRYDAYSTFRERFDKVKELFLTYKCTVKTCTPDDPVTRLAAAPEAESKRKEGNRVTNEKKKRRIAAGRGALGQDGKKQPRAAEGEEEEEDGAAGSGNA
ncbi:hypothetical protein NKR19_g8983 [Coniochaeta hoffmannii]|uniref:Uncharacterized protein n=1 Tax=Coniochaeta hoffmannii TaxID=91930 RepID=A0AA38VIA7_9PEZI|nr:hypothetical protein NKR19_g8983 [Coniochaeta hoffmannii]